MVSRLSHRRVHSGQIVAAQVAVALVVITAGHPGGLLAATALLAVAFGRLRRRWLYQWCRPAVGLATRRRTAPAGVDTAGLLALAHPGIRLREAPLAGRPAAVLTGGYGDTAVLEVGEPAGGLAEPVQVPGLTGLPADVRTLASACAAPAGSDPPTTSYRDLTGGAALTTRRVLLAVRVPYGDDLDAAVREVGRRLAPLPVRPLTTGAIDRALAGSGYGAPVREGWSAVHAGGLAHVTYHLGAAADLVPRLLSLPAVATTVAVRGAEEVLVRVAIDPEDGALVADRALRGLLAERSGAASRLDGEHLPGVAATLPLAAPAAASPAPAAAAGAPHADVRVEPAGVMLGRDRHGAPVLAELFGPAPVRVVLVGDLHLAQLLAWRALGAGAQVRVHTGRHDAWRPVARAAEGSPLWLAPGRDRAAPHRPVLHLVDPPGTGEPDPPEGGWSAQVLVCPRVTASDAGLLSQAGMVLARGLDEQESTLVSAALGLGRAGVGLRRVDPQAVTVLSRGAVREVLMSLTATERHLVGPSPVGAVA